MKAWKILAAAGTLILGITAAFQSAGAATLNVNEFQLESAGELCGTFVTAIQEGNHIKITFADAGIRLSPYGADVLRQKCTIRIPARIPIGYTIAKLTSRVESQLQKPRASTLLIQLDTSLSTYPILSHRSEYGVGESKYGLDSAMTSYTSSAELSEWRNELCNPGRSADTILGFGLGVFATTNSSTQSLTADFSGPLRGIDLWTELRPCL